MTSYQHLPLAVNFVSIYLRVSLGSDDIVYQYPSFENAVCSQHYGLFILDRLAVPATQHIQSVIVPVGSCHL